MSSRFEEGAVYESLDPKGDVFVVTKVESAGLDNDQVSFVWLASDAPNIEQYLGQQHSFYPDTSSWSRYRRML